MTGGWGNDSLSWDVTAATPVVVVFAECETAVQFPLFHESRLFYLPKALVGAQNEVEIL